MAEINTENPINSPQTNESKKVSKEIKFKELTEKYGISQGSELSIKKIDIDQADNSDIKVGDSLSGVISQEIGLGEPLIFSNEGIFAGKTTGIVNIREKDGRLQFLTQTNSVYEVIPKKNEVEEEMEKYINKNFDKQPETTKDILTNHKELFVTSKEIDNKIWFFTKNYGNKVMALVNSDEEPDVFRPRFFRMSGSDHQFKAYPGYRSNMEALKGKEDEDNHHYVQSAKLDSRIILTLQELPKEKDYKKRQLISDYMPVMADLDKNIPGKNLEDFKFSEEQVKFKNEDWQRIQEYQKYFFKTYGYLNHRVGNKNAKNFYNGLASINKF
ncbi:MAG: hypothetical protein WCG91_03080 [Candidatus Shapirobacteria bacterium]